MAPGRLKRTENKSPLKAYRLMAAIGTQGELARALGLTPATVARIECGYRGASIPILRKWARVLGVTLEQIIDAMDKTRANRKQRLIQEKGETP